MTSSYSPAQSAGHPIPPNRIEQFLHAYEIGNRDFRYLGNLRDIDLSGKNLSEPNSKEEYLNLSGTYLRSANLSEAKLFLADLSEANLSEANLSRAKLSFANLSKANLTGAKLYGADLREATLHDTKFENAYYDEQTQFPKTFNPEKNGLKKEWISSAPAVELTEVQSPHSTLSIQNPISVKPTEVQPSLVEKLNEKPVKGEQESADQLKAKGLNWQSKKEKRSKVPIQKTSRDELQENKDKADKIGLKGEVAVNAFLNKLQQEGQIDSYEWVSDSNATSPYDFWVSIESQQKTLIDVKSTNGKFDNVIHISLSELQQMGYGDERYDIYRVFEIDETNKNVKLRILENARDFAKSILNIFYGLPTGVLADSISVEPSTLDFLPEIITIQIPD